MFFNLSIPSISIQIQIFSRCQALETELFFRISSEIPIKIGNCTVEEINLKLSMKNLSNLAFLYNTPSSVKHDNVMSELH